MRADGVVIGEILDIQKFIIEMPKVELHVHLEGSIQPETFLKLAKRHKKELPADTVEGLRRWFAFTDFRHFLEVYISIASCLKTPEDIELITREFLQGQARQNIVYTEATYTPFTQFTFHGIPFDEQLAAINSARDWAKDALGIDMNLTLDISRHVSPEDGMVTAKWSAASIGKGVTALGLGGPEAGNPPEKFVKAFALAKEAGLLSVPHAGEMAGPESIRSAVRLLSADRIGHGVRCMEDAELVAELRDRKIPLEVCPTSNVCLGLYKSIGEHPVQRMMDAGLVVTINSDDPPLFGTTLTDELNVCADAFGWGAEDLKWLMGVASEASASRHSRAGGNPASFPEQSH
ncbi:MAG TPA: adenosine deaminase [Nitrospirota bacterium]|jgi:adenosine deaminase